MAIDGKVESAGTSGSQLLQFAFSSLDAGQHFIGQSHDTQCRCSESGGSSTSVKQGSLKAYLEVAQLVREGGLGDVQSFGGFLQASGVADGAERLHMTYFKQHAGFP